MQGKSGNMKNIVSVVILAALVSACSETPSQHQYNFNEVGQAINIEYALVVGAKQVGITGNAASGPSLAKPNIPGSYIGTEIDGIWETAGAAAKQAQADKKGYEYTVVTEGKATKTIVQYQNPEDIVFSPGEMVMLQETGTFHRLLTTASMPDKILAPHKKKLEELYETPETEAKPAAPEHAKPQAPTPEPAAVQAPEPSATTFQLPTPGYR